MVTINLPATEVGSKRAFAKTKIMRTNTIESKTDCDRYQSGENMGTITNTSPSTAHVNDSCLTILVHAIRYTGGIVAIFYRYMIGKTSWTICSDGCLSSIEGSADENDITDATTSDSDIRTKSSFDHILIDKSLTYRTVDERYIPNLKSISFRVESGDDDPSLQALNDFKDILDCTTGNCEESKCNITSIQHCQQLNSWDCGIACLQMILRWLRNNDGNGNGELNDYGGSEILSAQEKLERLWMLRAIGTESIWTIDLIILLQKLLSEYRKMLKFPQNENDALDSVSASYLFCSSKLGVDQSYNDYSYYRTAFNSDVTRVTNRFHLAEKLGLPLICIPDLELFHVIDFITRWNCVAVALLDNQILLNLHEYLNPKQTVPSKSCSGSTIFSMSQEDMDDVGRYTRHADEGIETILSQQEWCESQDQDQCHELRYDPLEKQPTKDAVEPNCYSGHYVILCGISAAPDHIAKAQQNFGESSESPYCLVIKNPGVDSAVMFITPDHFELAWRANGTDEDIIFITKAYR